MSAEDVSFAIIEQRHYQEFSTLENALNLNLQKLLGPWS